MDYDLEWVEARRRHALAARHAAVARARGVGRRGRAGAKAAPLACVGFTDSHWLREAFGTVAYGFFPLAGELPPEVAASLIHSADERIPVADLELGVGWLRHAAHAMLD